MKPLVSSVLWTVSLWSLIICCDTRSIHVGAHVQEEVNLNEGLSVLMTQGSPRRSWPLTPLHPLRPQTSEGACVYIEWWHSPPLHHSWTFVTPICAVSFLILTSCYYNVALSYESVSVLSAPQHITALHVDICRRTESDSHIECEVKSIDVFDIKCSSRCWNIALLKSDVASWLWTNVESVCAAFFSVFVDVRKLNLTEALSGGKVWSDSFNVNWF